MAADYKTGTTGPLFVASTAGMVIGDTIQIMLDNNELFKTTIAAVGSGLITISNPLPASASAGNIVLDLTQSKNVAPVTSSDIT